MSATISTSNLPAEALGLGNPTAEYKASTGRTSAGGIVFLAAAGMCAAVIIGAFSEADFSTRGIVIMGILTLAFLGGAIWQFSLAIGNRGLRIVVLDQGLVRLRGGKTEVLRWDDIATVYQQVTDHYRYGVKVNTSHIYTVHTQDGRKLVFNDVIKNVGALGETIQQEATNRLLPKYAERLTSGETLTFNRLLINRDGIGTSKEIVPWNDIDTVKLSAGQISVVRQGKPLGWVGQSVAQTPNAPSFMTLVNRIKGVG